MKNFEGHHQEKQVFNQDSWSVTAEIHYLTLKLNDFIFNRINVEKSTKGIFNLFCEASWLTNKHILLTVTKSEEELALN